jgi:phosphosulfolactate synthase (CoM biosynthesis protein A)
LGLLRTRDLREAAGDCLDLAKIATGSSRLCDEGILIEKQALYRAHGVRPLLGGRFREAIWEVSA